MTRPRHLDPLHIALAFSVVAVWGSNFVVIKAGLRELPPLLFATLRFVACVVPFAFFVARPKVAWRWLAACGVALGGQFALLFYAMRADISPGLASLLIQLQVFFTIAISMWLFHERTTAVTWGGSLLAAAGLALIALHLDATLTALGVALVVGAALAWAIANIVVKRVAKASTEPVNMLGFMVWCSFFAVPPLLLVSLALEGWDAIATAVVAASPMAWAAVAWQAVGNTLFGYTAWGWLLARYDASVISPWALLVPVFGMGSSALLLGEPMPPWKLAAGAMVLGGIALITFWRR